MTAPYVDAHDRVFGILRGEIPDTRAAADVAAVSRTPGPLETPRRVPSAFSPDATATSTPQPQSLVPALLNLPPDRVASRASMNILLQAGLSAVAPLADALLGPSTNAMTRDVQLTRQALARGELGIPPTADPLDVPTYLRRGLTPDKLEMPKALQDMQYTNIPFPLPEVGSPQWQEEKSWFEDLMSGYYKQEAVSTATGGRAVAVDPIDILKRFAGIPRKVFVEERSNLLGEPMVVSTPNQTMLLRAAQPPATTVGDLLYGVSLHDPSVVNDVGLHAIGRGNVIDVPALTRKTVAKTLFDQFFKDTGAP